MAFQFNITDASGANQNSYTAKVPDTKNHYNCEPLGLLLLL